MSGCEQKKTFADFILAFEEHSLKYFSILRHFVDQRTNHLIKKKNRAGDYSTVKIKSFCSPTLYCFYIFYSVL